MKYISNFELEKKVLTMIGSKGEDEVDQKRTSYMTECPELSFQTVQNPHDLSAVHTYSIISPKGSFNSSMRFDEMERYTPFRRRHCHTYFELFYVLRGEMYQIIENKRHLYLPGSLCILNKNIRHCAEFSTEFQVAYVSLPVSLVQALLAEQGSAFFSEEGILQDSLISRFFNHNLTEKSTSVYEYIDFIPCGKDEDIGKAMYGLFENLTREFLFPHPGSTYAVKSILLQIFSALAKPDNYQTVPIHLGSKKESLLFDCATALLKESGGRMTRSDLEREMNYSGVYLNSIVKKYTGLSIFQYGMTICMKEAERLLRETEEPVCGIAERLGFSNRTHFYKIFQQIYGETPGEFRKHAQNLSA